MNDHYNQSSIMNLIADELQVLVENLSIRSGAFPCIFSINKPNLSDREIAMFADDLPIDCGCYGSSDCQGGWYSFFRDSPNDKWQGKRECVPFWFLLEDLDSEQPEVDLENRLNEFEPDLIKRFQQVFNGYHKQIYNWQLWNAAYLMEGGCSDDGFIDFRYGLISRGRRAYEATLKSPDDLADFVTEDDFLSNQEFGYVAWNVYNEKSDDDLMDVMNEEGHPADHLNRGPTGDDWDPSDHEAAEQRLPKIWAKFCE